MSTLVAEPLAVAAWCDDESLWVKLDDGRRLAVPLGFFPRLMHATAVQRANYELIGEGIGIHWPDVDEDLSVEGLLLGGRDNTKLGREHAEHCDICRSSLSR